MAPDVDGLTFADYTRVVRQRKWTIVIVAVLCVSATFFYTSRQARQYAGTAQVFVERQNLAAVLTGADDGSSKGDPDRLVQTQRALAKAPIVARRTLEALRVHDLAARTLLANVTVTANGAADVLNFEVRASSRRRAERLATEYARQFVRYRRDLDTGALERARRGLEESLRNLGESNKKNPQLFADLASKEQQLRTMEALQTGNASIFKPADDAAQISPKPVRNLALGLMLGLILGLVAAFVRNASDSRVRSLDTRHALSDLPELARIPTPPRRLRVTSGLAMLADPEGEDAESTRVLRASFESALEKRGGSSVMVTSSLPGEGKSTTIANLAVALARAGRRVILVDLDLRRPSQHQFFRLGDGPGVTDVLSGQSTLDAALTPPAVFDAGAGKQQSPQGYSAIDSPLAVLTAGMNREHAGDLVASPRLLELLGDIRSRADIVLVDAPALLVGGDAITLSAGVDALLFVLRLNVTRRPAIDDVQLMLGNCHASPLGCVVTGADRNSSFGYGRYAYRGGTDLGKIVDFGPAARGLSAADRAGEGPR